MHSKNGIFEDSDLTVRSESVIRPGGFILTRNMVEACRLEAGNRVVDVGCGEGVTVDYLRCQYGLDATGVDISEKMISKGSRRFPEATLIAGSAERLPLPSAWADAIFSECSLSVVTDTDTAFMEMRRVLKPGGKLAISDVYIREENGAESLRRHVQGGCFFNAFTRNELNAKLESCGYALTVWEDRTDLWRNYVAELLMGNCTVQKLWHAVANEPGESFCFSDALKRARPGYFWMVAEKR